MPRVYSRRVPLRGGGETVVYYLDYTDERGRRVREPARGPDGRTLTNRAAAERALHRALGDVQSRRADPWRQHGDGSQDLAEFVAGHVRDHVAALASARHRRAHLDRWLEHFGPGARLRDVTRAEIERRMAERLRSGASPATVQRELASLSKAMASAVQRGLVPVNPVSGVRAPRHDHHRTRYLTGDECAALLEASAAGPGWLLPLVLLALDAGGRLGECRSVVASDVDASANLVTFRHTKARRIRHVPLTPRLLAALGPWLARRRPWPDHRHSFDAALERAKLGPDVTFHILRHTFATRLAAAGCPLPVLQELLGHSTIVMTQRYAHVSDDAKRRAIGLLAQSRHSDPSGEG